MVSSKRKLQVCLLLAMVPVLAFAAPVDDRLPPGSTIHRLVEISLVRSAQLRDAEIVWQAAQMDVEEAKGALWPKVDFNANSQAATIGKGNPNGNGTTGRAGATVSYTVS